MLWLVSIVVPAWLATHLVQVIIQARRLTATTYFYAASGVNCPPVLGLLIKAPKCPALVLTTRNRYRNRRGVGASADLRAAQEKFLTDVKTYNASSKNNF